MLVLKVFIVLLSSWPVNKAVLFPFHFAVVEDYDFFCAKVLEGGIRKFCFAILIGKTSIYLFLHIGLTMPAQNTSSLQYAD